MAGGGALGAPGMAGSGMWPQGNGGVGGGGGEANVYQQGSAAGAQLGGGLLAVNCYDNILRVYERLALGPQAHAPQASLAAPAPDGAATAGEATSSGGARTMAQLPELLRQRPLFHLQVGCGCRLPSCRSCVATWQPRPPRLPRALLAPLTQPLARLVCSFTSRPFPSRPWSLGVLVCSRPGTSLARERGSHQVAVPA